MLRVGFRYFYLVSTASRGRRTNNATMHVISLLRQGDFYLRGRMAQAGNYGTVEISMVLSE
jgi:hypothetical protein